MQSVELYMLQLWALAFGTSFVLYFVRRGAYWKRSWYLRAARWTNVTKGNASSAQCLVIGVLYLHGLIALCINPLMSYPWLCFISGFTLGAKDYAKRSAVYIHQHRLVSVLVFLILLFCGLNRPFLLAPAIVMDLLDTLGWYLLSDMEYKHLSNQYLFFYNDNKKNNERKGCGRLWKRLLHKDVPSGGEISGKPQEGQTGDSEPDASGL